MGYIKPCNEMTKLDQLKKQSELNRKSISNGRNDAGEQAEINSLKPQVYGGSTNKKLNRQVYYE